MSDEKALVETHPAGDPDTAGMQASETVTSVDTFAGKVQMKWLPEGSVSRLGLMPFLLNF